MMKIRVMMPKTSISVNTIQHHRLAAARSRHGSNTTLWCYSLPWRRFATSSGRQKRNIYAFPKREATATVLWCSPDTLRYRNNYIMNINFCQQLPLILFSRSFYNNTPLFQGQYTTYKPFSFFLSSLYRAQRKRFS